MELSSADRKLIFDKLAEMRREVTHLSGEILRLENAVRVKNESNITKEMVPLMPRCSKLQQLSGLISEILDAARNGPRTTLTGDAVGRIVNVRGNAAQLAGQSGSFGAGQIPIPSK